MVIWYLSQRLRLTGAVVSRFHVSRSTAYMALLCFGARRFEYKASNFAIRPRSNLDLPRLGCSWARLQRTASHGNHLDISCSFLWGARSRTPNSKRRIVRSTGLVVLKSQHAEVKKETLRREIRRQRATRNHSVLAKCATGDPVVWRVQAFSRFCNAQ